MASPLFDFWGFWEALRGLKPAVAYLRTSSAGREGFLIRARQEKREHAKVMLCTCFIGPSSVQLALDPPLDPPLALLRGQGQRALVVREELPRDLFPMLTALHVEQAKEFLIWLEVRALPGPPLSEIVVDFISLSVLSPAPDAQVRE